MTTVIPSSLFKRTRVSNTNFFAPMSIPRVGSETNRNFGDMHSALAIHTFCWLPPDKVPECWVGPKQRMSRLFMYSSAVSRIFLLSIWVNGPNFFKYSPLICMALNTILSSMERSNKRPTPLRSSETMATPALKTDLVSLKFNSCPNSSTFPSAS